jgi:hypothetical protein
VLFFKFPQITAEQQKAYLAAIQSKSRVCPVCDLERSDHYIMLNHIVGHHPEVAALCIPYRCDACKTAFKSQNAVNKHHSNKTCKKRRLSGESSDAVKFAKVETKCCGYSFSGRQWNFERHQRTKHGIGEQAEC